MAISVDIADRQYDYTDEEKAADAVAELQAVMNLSDDDVVSIWANSNDPRRAEIERRIFEAVDANGSEKRARETIPNGIDLIIS